ncbi:FdhD protein [Bisgaardia hudsonensis]|uniref:Sulfur carrier protein FdhD n=1 Tax=Bisgaardia hudsonensis TaxID=109472 RepID=A0A4R2N126_9PAST|nr:formate dehydrogenase accessory sulfurtransferase FdhD [Bisgaardia hudsonensis]QLB13208.1 sulfurtransferase FdhD [Bisgaardia hudsonensis]TCP13214.1 FdhD protein [Bisgaardia hudsonensis]
MTWITKKKISYINKQKSLTNKNDNISYLEKEDILAKESPIALVYNGISHTVMMASPKNLEDFAIGFSITEGIIENPKDIYGIDIEEKINGIEIQLEISSRCFVHFKDHRRTLSGKTGCGICGTEQLNQVIKKLPILDRTFTFNIALLDNCLKKVKEMQELGKQTGATHAAAFFNTQGEFVAIREDVGRHIALDKLLGWYVKNGSPKGFIITTSRASYEMVQKTISVGIEMLVVMSAATDLAVQIADESNLTLIGFAREGKANIYTHKTRLYIK